MSAVFLKLLNMSIAAGWLVVAVIALRLCLKKAPKAIHCALWALVAIRLICPFSLESSFSLIPEEVANGSVVSEWTDDYIDDIDIHHPNSVYYDAAVGAGREPISDGEGGYYVVTKHDQLGEPATIENTVVPVLSWIWIAGVAALLLYAAVSYLRIHSRVKVSLNWKDNIWRSEQVDSPFILGVIRPKIYLPFGMEEIQMHHVVAHEQAHLSRRDHWWKPFGFILLAVYWFNPLMWVAYILLCRDIELACDEKVIRDMGAQDKKAYSEALLACSVPRRMIAACPLAFGEVGVKKRIASVLHYKKPAFWILVIALVATGVVAVCFLTNPAEEESSNEFITWEINADYPEAVVDIVNDYVMQQVEYYNDLGSGETAIGGEYSILGAKVVGLKSMEPAPYDETHTVGLYLLEYRLLPSEPDHVVLAGGMQMEEDWITEWGSTGQPYLALMHEETDEEDIWTLVGVTNSDSLNMDYGTEEMVARYNSKYIAAAMELCNAYMSSAEQGNYGTANDVSYYLELAADTEFQNMKLDRQTSILVEYEDLLDDYTFIARESKDGTTAYIVGQYNGKPTESPLYGMYSVEVFFNDNKDSFQFLYSEEESEIVDAVLAANKKEFPPSAGYSIEDSRILWSTNSGVVLIQPKDTELSLDVPWNRYLYTPYGREYIADAVSRGIDVCGRTDTFLYVYRFDQRFGNLAERIALTEAEAQAILTEERVTLPEGFGFSATLHMNGETKYFYTDGENKYYDPPREGIPQSVLDLAAEKCGYTFVSPSDINGRILSARLDCDWLDTPLYAAEADLPRLKEILTNAEYALVRGHNYGARLTLSLSDGKTLTLFKDSDGFDTIVFGSYGGYFLGEKENIEFWEMFGLDPETKTRIETNPAGKETGTVFSIGDLLLEVTGVQSTRRETMLAEGVEPHEYSVFTYSPGATITVKNAGMRDGSYYEDGEPYATWGLSYTGERERTRITDATKVIPITPELEGVYNLEASLFVLKFEPVTQGLSESVEEEIPVPTAPPKETDIHNAIMANNRWATKTDALYPYRTEAHHIWGMKQNGNRCTVYALGYRTTYEWGNGQPKRIYPEQVGSMELVFEWDGRWSLTSFWMPTENEDSIVSIRNRFPSDIAAIVLGEVDADILAALNAQCHDAALQYYATLTNLPPAKSFTTADVEFSGQALTGSPDEMAYEERLQWVEAGPDYSQTFTSLGQYAEGEGCIAYLATWVGVPRGNGQVFQLRFADGMLAYLPMPDENAVSPALPDNMVFTNGKLVYDKTFPTQEVTNEGETLIHLKGTYHYEVDLTAKTVSLTVLQ